MGRQPNFGTPIALGLIIAALVMGYFNFSSGSQLSSGQRSIEVKGSATRKVQADRAIWTGRTFNESSSLARVQEMGRKDREVLQNFVKDRGFDSTRIEFRPAKLQRDPSGPGSPYTIVQEFRLAGNELDRIRACAMESSSLMARGINIRSDRPIFRYSKLAQLQKELLPEASADARQRAASIADTSGVNIIAPIMLKEKGLTVMGRAPNQGIGPDNASLSSPTGTVELQVKASYRFE